jgi:hypothetical protein
MSRAMNRTVGKVVEKTLFLTVRKKLISIGPSG